MSFKGKEKVGNGKGKKHRAVDADEPVVDDETVPTKAKKLKSDTDASEVEHRLYKVKGADGAWHSCSKSTKGRKTDCIVEWYSRNVGFAQPQDAEMAADKSGKMAEAMEKLSARGDDHVKSHEDIIQKYAIFERWLLDEFPLDPHAKWLASLRVETKKVEFQVHFAFLHHPSTGWTPL